MAVSLWIPQETWTKLDKESMVTKIEVISCSHPNRKFYSCKFNFHASPPHAMVRISIWLNFKIIYKMGRWWVQKFAQPVAQTFGAPKRTKYFWVNRIKLYSISEHNQVHVWVLILIDKIHLNQLIEWISHQWQCLNHKFFNDQDSHAAS